MTAITFNATYVSLHVTVLTNR